MNQTEELLRVVNLSVTFVHEKKSMKALSNINLTIKKGEVLGIVGESGCGKTTLGRTIVRLQKEDCGNIFLENTDLCSLKATQLRTIRKRMQMVFQNPFSSLNPRMSVLDCIAEAIPGRLTSSQKISQVSNLMTTTGLDPEMMRKFPHEFSGGQRQRIAIARALATQPSLIIADEPVSSLDVSVQAQILNMFKKLHQSFSLTMLFISHDLAVVKYICDTVAVMYRGHIVEIGPVNSLFRAPAHPYTRQLLNAVPQIDPDLKTADNKVYLIPVKELSGVTAGCPCFSICPFSINACKEYTPVLESTHSEDHKVACIRSSELLL
jgi:oligopeptide/dipeptide ABC transporter ATP-binding protein